MAADGSAARDARKSVSHHVPRRDSLAYPRSSTMRVLHVQWSSSRLWVWAESAEQWASMPPRDPAPRPADPTAEPHPFVEPIASITELLARLVPGAAGTPGGLDLLLPIDPSGVTLPSLRLAHHLGRSTESGGTSLSRVTIQAISLALGDASHLLDSFETLHDDPSWQLSSDAHFFQAALQLARHLVAQQRLVPSLRQELSGALKGVWQPWLSDPATTQRLSVLLASMPPSARSVVDNFGHQPWPMLEDFLTSMVDASVRQTLRHESMNEAIDGREPGTDVHVAWLGGLLDRNESLATTASQRPELVKHVRRWLSGLEDRGASSSWRLCLRLQEPDPSLLGPSTDESASDVRWPLTFHLQSLDQRTLLIDASDIWLLPSDSLTVQGKRVDEPQELLLKELARCGRLYPAVERALDHSEPSKLDLDTRQAYHFLREIRPILLEQGFGVEVPPWWDWPSARVGATLRLDSQPIDLLKPETGPGMVQPRAPRLGMNAIVNYGWQITVGGTTLSLDEFQRLAERKVPLVRVNGQWVEIRPEDLQAAIKFIRENPGGEVRVGEALEWTYGERSEKIGIPIVGLEATGWLSAIFGDPSAREQIPSLGTPPGFRGTLRSYQERGLSWLVFLERLGFGPCLADDMGLGKTVQLLGLLAHERPIFSEDGVTTEPAALPPPQPAATNGSTSHETAESKSLAVMNPSPVAPTLLVVPMSVAGNWIREATRFCPRLKLMLHHGTDRLLGEAFENRARDVDAVVTTYALAARDKETLGRIHWRRVVLDEAQCIKNPSTKQTQAVISLPTDGRVALTGTPVENRLSELWSIMEFLNPGYLGTGGGFRKRFSVPIERYKDSSRSRQLRELVRPFVLRRLKSDPSIAADLPEKLETREYALLTTEQAELYEALVKRMLNEVELSEGIQRRGLVLATLIKLKQVCNHPSQLLKDHPANSPTPPDPSRSGKCQRLIEMLDEVIAAGDRALVFTQFREMAELLAAMLRHALDRDILLFHGGTTQVQREQIVARFQRPDGNAPVLVVSLKAGGVGLNLTAATHVFHFDRWWNPAVENQATDRAHRIGQNRTVHVHKFVVRGTLEERIDEMIEQKTELAKSIVGSGEQWLTELSTDQLRDILTLRKDAIGDEG